MHPLFETIRIVDSVPQNLEWHQRRVNTTFNSLYNSSPLQLAEHLNVPHGFTQGLVKCKFLYDDYTWTAEFSHYTPKSVKSLRLIETSDIEYTYKYSNRSALDDLYMQREDCDDIIIVKNKHITDTSIANIIFFNGNEWYTPSTPLLKGTCRARLLKDGLIREAEITIFNLKEYSHLMLINAMNDFNKNAILSLPSTIRNSG